MIKLEKDKVSTIFINSVGNLKICYIDKDGFPNSIEFSLTKIQEKQILEDLKG